MIDIVKIRLWYAFHSDICILNDLMLWRYTGASDWQSDSQNTLITCIVLSVGLKCFIAQRFTECKVVSDDKLLRDLHSHYSLVDDWCCNNASL